MLVALLLLSFACLVAVNVLWLFLTLPWVGLQFVIAVFPDHTHFRFVLVHRYDFEIVLFQFLDEDVPRSPLYGVCISQLIRFARVCLNVTVTSTAEINF